MRWPSYAQRLCARLGISVPIVQSPMAGIQQGPGLAIAVAKAGGLGSLPCGMLSSKQIEDAVAGFRAEMGPNTPLNLNFFCHRPPALKGSSEDPGTNDECKRTMESLRQWRDVLAPYYAQMGAAAPDCDIVRPSRNPFDDELCALVERLRPSVVSFHFGLPADVALWHRVKSTGAVTISSATTVEEAVWLQQQGVDVVIAQGSEAGGHRATFLTVGYADLLETAHCQLGTLALLPQIIDNVQVPVIAAGGIVDGRGIASALLLGAHAIQIGTAFLLSAESECSLPRRRAMLDDKPTAITNLFTGRPARSQVGRLMHDLGPLNRHVPPFPLASALLAPLCEKAAKRDAEDGGNFQATFMPLYMGEAYQLARKLWKDRSATEIVEEMARHALSLFAK